MKITQLYTHPIKSLRPVPLTTTTLTSSGIPYDRRFLLLRAHFSPQNGTAHPTIDNLRRAAPSDGEGHRDESPQTLPAKPRSKSHFNAETGLENMTITYYPELALLSQSIDESHGVINVTYHPPSSASPESPPEEKVLQIPLLPDVSKLQLQEINLHNSPTQAYRMPDSYGEWFASALGWDVQLIYLGEGRRKVLGNLAPNPTFNSATQGASWMGSVAQGLTSRFWGGEEVKNEESEEGLTLVDVAPYLIITEESLEDVSARLPVGVEMDRTKFRANIVVSGAERAWEEDFWGGLKVGGGEGEGGGEILLTGNCGRCVSLNVDYETGKAGVGEKGMVLKKMMKDRRVDRGNKWSPIFGRYGFLKGGGGSVKVGDKVRVERWNEERTVFDWPGIGS